MQLDSPTSRVQATIDFTRADITTGQAVKALRKLVAAAEPLGHPCVPAVEPIAGDGLACPLLLPGDLVRADWFSSQLPPAIEGPAASGDTFELACFYRPAYADEEGETWPAITVTWDEADLPLSTFCRAEERDTGNWVRRSTGHHPVEIEISNEFVERWSDAAEALAHAL